MSAPAIGIDLGTTYSCVGVFQHGKVEIIANEQGNRTTPSVVAFNENERLVGEVARGQAARNAENTVFDAKRMIGRKFGDEELKRDLDHWPFKVTNCMGEPKISVMYKEEKKLFSPMEISAMVLTSMKKTAEAYLGTTVTDAVITVPAYFNNSQRQATKDAGKIAGLNVKRIINEPTAAALAYGLDKKLDQEQKILIFDLGGGTFDVSILSVAENVFEVLSTAGDTHLGGEDFDNRLVKHFSTEFKRKYRKDLTKSPMALRKLKTACEEAKRTLSSCSVAHVEIDSLYEGVDFSSKISRARFDELCVDQFRSTLDTVRRALEDASLERSSIDEVVLVGGSTRIPKIRKLLEDFFDGKRLNLRINADEAVAYGAAVQAAALSGISTPGADDHLLLDVVPFSLGVKEGENNFQRLIDRNSHVPIRREREFILSSDYQTTAGIEVYEGEHSLARSNHLLGEFKLDRLPAARRGEVKFSITFDVDADGIMSVSAHEKTTGRQEEIQIRCLNFMGPDALRKMQEDAERMEAESAEEERKRREEMDEDVYGGGEDGEYDDARSWNTTERNSAMHGGDEENHDKQDQGEKEEGIPRNGTRRGVYAQRGDREEKGGNDEDSQPGGKARDIAGSQRKTGEERGEELREMSRKGERCDAEPQSTQHVQLPATGQSKRSDKLQQNDKHDELQRENNYPVDKMSENMLFAVETLLAGEPSASITARLETFSRCKGILEKVSTSTSDSRAKERCSTLNVQLRERYAEAVSSYNVVTSVPGREPSTLKERVLDYIRGILEGVVDSSGTISNDDTLKVNGMAVDLLYWIDSNESAGADELLKRIKELKSTCEGVKGLHVPGDDVPWRSKPSGKDPGQETGRHSRSAGQESQERTREASWDDGGRGRRESVSDDEDYGTQQSNSDMPELEEVF